MNTHYFQHELNKLNESSADRNVRGTYYEMDCASTKVRASIVRGITTTQLRACKVGRNHDEISTKGEERSRNTMTGYDDAYHYA